MDPTTTMSSSVQGRASHFWISGLTGGSYATTYLWARSTDLAANIPDRSGFTATRSWHAALGSRVTNIPCITNMTCLPSIETAEQAGVLISAMASGEPAKYAWDMKAVISAYRDRSETPQYYQLSREGPVMCDYNTPS